MKTQPHFACKIAKLYEDSWRIEKVYTQICLYIVFLTCILKK